MATGSDLVELRSMLQSLIDSNADIRDRVVASRVYMEERLSKLETSVAALASAVTNLQAQSSAATTAKRSRREDATSAEPETSIDSSDEDESPRDDHAAAASASSGSASGRPAVGFKRVRGSGAAAAAGGAGAASSSGIAGSQLVSTSASTAVISVAAAAAGRPNTRGAAAASQRGAAMAMKPDPDPGAAAMKPDLGASSVKPRIKLTFRNANQDKIVADCSPSTRIGTVIKAVLEQTGWCDFNACNVMRDGAFLYLWQTVAECGLESGDAVDVLPAQTGGMMHETSGRWGLDALK